MGLKKSNFFSEKTLYFRSYLGNTVDTLDFKLLLYSECCILSFGWFPSIWILYVDVSEHSVSSFLDGVSRKNNQDEIVGVFIREKVWLENSVSQSEGGGWGAGGSKLRNRLWRARTPKWRPVVCMWGRNGTVGVHLPSDWLRLFLSQNFSHINTPTI